MYSHSIRGRDSSVGIATSHGLDGPGIESRLGARFSAPFQTGPGAHSASYAMVTGSFPGVKRPGSGVDHPPPSSAQTEGRVELYIYSPSGPSWPVLGRTLPLPLACQTKYFMHYTFSCVCCMPTLFHLSNNNLRAVQIMKLVISFLRACIISRHKVN